jgi:hypothetical protein
VHVEWARHNGRAVIVVNGLHSAPAGLVRVQPADAVHTSVATAGTWSECEAGLCFAPRFPVLAGTTYAVLVHESLLPVVGADDDGGDDFLSFLIEAPMPAMLPSTRVVAVYPSGGVIPRNQLRMYVQFSEAMSEGFASRNVWIELAERADRVADALLPMEVELWDPSRTRLTVLFDPGRIKRGLVPHTEAGYPLVVDSSIRVVIGPDFLDARGRPLVEGHTASYRVTDDLRGKVDPDRWTFDTPAAGTRNPLVVHFDRPLDHGLLRRCITVPGVNGRAAIGSEERSWSFVPDAPWRASGVRLLIDPILEDGAGNSVARVFDRDLRDRADDPRDRQALYLDVDLSRAEG